MANSSREKSGSRDNPNLKKKAAGWQPATSTNNTHKIQ
jgi:hypothetical protein